MRKKSIFKKVFLICICFIPIFLSFSSTGMVPVKAQEEEIGRNKVDAYGGTFGEIVTMELIAYDDSRDVGTYRFRYYLYHSGESYTYQVAAVGVFLDGVHKATFGDHLGKDYQFSNDTRLFGTADVEVPAGATHRFRLEDIGTGGLTEVSIDKDVYIPYPSYNVVYKDWNGNILKSQSVTKYQNATAPNTPSRTGYTFTGWSDDGKDIRGNRIINAQYSINYYTVRYLDYDGSVLKNQSVPYSSNATPPDNPKRVGYSFTGWSTNSMNITSNRDITANYSINNYNITFNSMGGSSVATQSVQYQSKVTVPTPPSKPNFKFIGWYTDPLYKTEYNFNSKIGASDIILYAKWDANPTIKANDITIHDNQYTTLQWNTLKLKDVSAFDVEDGNLTNKIIIISDTVDLTKEGDYKVTYQIMDSVGSIVMKEVKVKVLFNNPPIIAYKDFSFYEDEITLQKWKKDYVMNNVTAEDIEDGVLTSDIKIVSDNVNPSIPGDYQVVYGVTDQYNKTTKVTAKIKIKYNNPPHITVSDKQLMQNQFTNEEWHEKYITKDVEAFDIEDGNITNIKVLEDDVDMTTPGNYHVKYKVTDKYGKSDTRTIQVKVVYNQVPIIHANNKSFYENELTSDEWSDEILNNITAFDSEDGDITKFIKIKKDTVQLSKAGSYEVIYSVKDSGGKSIEKTIDVTIKNNHAPRLEIFAENKRFVSGQYTNTDWKKNIRMSNVSAHDYEDNDITEDIEVINDNVDVDVAGKYFVTYKVTDKFGKSTAKTILVTVEENFAPIIYASEKWFDITEEINDKTLLKDVIAFDDIDGDITDKITISENTINKESAGDYTVTYTVADSLGKETSRIVMIHLFNYGNKPTPPPVDPPVKPSDEDAVIFANGKKYGLVELYKFMEPSDLIEVPYDSVVFGVYTADEITVNGKEVLGKDALVNVIHLDKNHKGNAKIYNEGFYYIKEIAVDNHYQLSDSKFYFEFRY